jgi:ComF family protein
MLKSLLRIFLKSPCSLCQRSAETTLCPYCQKQLRSYQFPYPQFKGLDDLDVLAWGKYEGQLKRAIALIKYENQPQLGELCGEWLGVTWLETYPTLKQTKINVIPIPLHPRKLQERGFNQAQAIAQGFCRVTGYTLHTGALIRAKDTAPLFPLSPQQRKVMLAQAFAVSPQSTKKLGNLPIILIDDIYTSGVTAQEARQTLSGVGKEVRGIAVVSRGLRPQKPAKDNYPASPPKPLLSPPLNLSQNPDSEYP